MLYCVTHFYHRFFTFLFGFIFLFHFSYIFRHKYRRCIIGYSISAIYRLQIDFSEKFAFQCLNRWHFPWLVGKAYVNKYHWSQSDISSSCKIYLSSYFSMRTLGSSINDVLVLWGRVLDFATSVKSPQINWRSFIWNFKYEHFETNWNDVHSKRLSKDRFKRNEKIMNENQIEFLLTLEYPCCHLNYD